MRREENTTDARAEIVRLDMTCEGDPRGRRRRHGAGDY